MEQVHGKKHCGKNRALERVKRKKGKLAVQVAPNQDHQDYDLKHGWRHPQEVTQ
jgi:hypothetical protein